MQFIHGLKALGYPLMIDSVQIRSIRQAPGQVQFSLSLAVLNYAAPAAGEKSGA